MASDEPMTTPTWEPVKADKPGPRCHAGRDGECYWKGCPQLRDREPEATGRDCPLWDWRKELDDDQ